LSEKNPKIEKAYELYKGGMKLVEIASQLTVAEGTVRSWKNRYKWDEECNATTKSVATKKRNVAKGSKAKNKAVAPEVKQVLKNPDLNDKQRLFCLYYSKSFNAAQSYAKAYGCTYATAMTNGPALLRNAQIKDEVMHLKELKLQSLFTSEDDFVDLHMRIAFADMGNYVSFGLKETPIIVDGAPLVNEEGKPLTYKANVVDLENSETVDTQLIKTVKEGKNGISIELIDRCKSLDWLDRYFMMNPMDKHKIEYDNKRLEIEKEKSGVGDDYKTINIIHSIPRPVKEGDEE